jgi:hypothetical protein
MTTWFRLRPPVRVLVIAVVWFSYAVLVLDLNALDSGSRSAKLIGIACLVGGLLRSASTEVCAPSAGQSSS